MNKQLTLIGAAVAAALGVGTTAQALPAADWTNGTITTVFYAGGGSAQVPAVYTAVFNCLVSSSIDVYTDGTGTTAHPASTSYIIVSGTVDSTKGCGATANVGFMYKFNGGSCPNGASPFLTAGATTLSYPAVAQVATATAIAGFSGTKSPINPNFSFTAGATLSGVAPDWGVTDTEASLCGYGWNLPPGSDAGLVQAFNTKNRAALWVSPFAIAVSADVYAQKTNFSKAEVAAIYQGNTNNGITSWAQLKGDNGAALTGLGGIALLDRSIGSGTRTGANAYFLGYPNNKFAIGGALAPNSIVNGYSTCSALSACGTGTFTSSFLDISEKTSQAIIDDLAFANAHNIGAIGALGVEFPPLYQQTTAGTNDYFFVQINGNGIDNGTGTTDNVNSATGPATTSYTHVIDGTYDYATQVGFAGKVADASQPAFPKGVIAHLKASSISDASASGSAWPAAAEGVLLDVATTGTTGAGNVSWTRGGNSAAAPVFISTVTAPFPVTIATQK